MNNQKNEELESILEKTFSDMCSSASPKLLDKFEEIIIGFKHKNG